MNLQGKSLSQRAGFDVRDDSADPSGGDTSPITRVVLLGPVSPPVTGPGVKNRMLAESLEAAGIEVVVINTLGWTRRPISTAGKVLGEAVRCKQVILSVSTNGRWLLLPLMWLLRIMMSIRFAVMPAGGALARELAHLPGLLRRAYLGILRKSDAVFVQTKLLANELAAFGLSNLKVLPNAKRWAPQRWSAETASPQRVVFLSKVKRTKGVEEAIEATKCLRENGIDVVLHIYGPIEEAYRPRFLALCEANPHVEYHGVVDPTQVPRVLSQYRVFVFPTYYSGEGFPGVLVDAVMAGVPTVATDWAANSEVIENGKTGILVPPRDSAALAAAIGQLLMDPQLASRLSGELASKAVEFDVDRVARRLVNTLCAVGWR